MKYFLLTLTVVLGFTTHAQTSFYEHPDFPNRAKLHEKVAFLPFEITVNLRPKELKDLSPEQLESMKENEAQGVQDALFSWFMKRKNQGRLMIDVQAPTATNAKLLRAGVTKDMIAAYEPSELCEILGVDAIIMGSLNTNKPMSQGAAVAMTLLIGGAASRQATMTFSIYEGSSNELMCNYQKKLTGALGSTNQDLVNVLMRKASRRIAYTRGFE